MRVWIAVALLLAVFVPAPVEGVCASPIVEVTRERVHAGDDIRIRGKHFFYGCDDHGGATGCGREESREPMFPITNVRFELKRGGRVLDAAEVDADESFKLEATLTVPDAARPGRHVVVATWGRTSDRIPVTVRARQR